MQRRGVLLERDKGSAPRGKIEELPPPPRLCVPLVGCEDAADRLVEEGSRVARGEALSSPRYGVPAISPVNGRVEEFLTVQHPVLGSVVCAVIVSNGQAPGAGVEREQEDTPAGIITAAGAAGILDEFDGSPLYKKLKRYRRNSKDLLVCCASDDDPCVSANAAVLREHPMEVLDGLALAARFCGGPGVRVLVDSGREKRLLRQSDPDAEIFVAGDRYPARALLKRRLYARGQKSGFLGAQACLALSRAVRRSEPQISCVVTVTGDCVREPRNLRVTIGTPVHALLERCGLLDVPEAVLLGSSVTGRQTEDLDAPVSANTRCVIAVRRLPRRQVYPCAGCGRCSRACPRGIQPWNIWKQLMQDKVNPARLQNVQNCIACGACSMICPSGADLAAIVLQAAALKKSGDTI